MTAIFVLVAVAASAATVTAEKTNRKDLNIVVPSAAGNGSGKLVVYGREKRELSLDDLFDGPGPVGSEIPRYGAVVVNIRESLVRVPFGGRRTFTVPADPMKLRVWTIGNVDALIGVVPGEVLTLRVGGCCATWNISSARLDPSEARPPVVYCSKYEEDCRAGFVDVLGERSVDPLCRRVAKPSVRTKRCMIPGAIRVVVDRDVHISITDGDPGEEQRAWEAHAGEVSEYVEVSSGTPDYWSLGVGESSYLLVIGPGEKWTVKVKLDGSVSGVRD